MNGGFDNDKFSEWMKEWADTVTRFAYHHSGNATLSQDIAQETFLRAYRHARSRGELPTAGWLFKVAAHIAIDEFRRARREHLGVEEIEGHHNGPTSEDMEVLDVLRRLSSADRECLVLFYFRDWPIEKVASHLKVPPSTIRTRLFRARERFRTLWEVTEP